MCLLEECSVEQKGLIMKWFDRLKDAILGDVTFIGEGDTPEEAMVDADNKAKEEGYSGKAFKYDVWCEDCNAWVEHLSICPHK